MPDSVHIKIVVKIGDETMVVEHKTPMYLGGDRRRWRNRIIEHITGQTEVIANRFTVPAPEHKPTAKSA